MVEISIGLICACLPSVNILYEHCTAARTLPNTPRTSTPRSSSHRKRITWSGLGAKDDRYQPSGDSERSGGSDARTSTPNKEPLVNFDLELAMISGDNSIRDTQDPEGIFSNSPNDYPSCSILDRADSSDGRREGWLSPERPGIRPSYQTGRLNARGDGCERDRDDVSSRLAEVSGNRPWSRIWDGKTNDTHAEHKQDTGST